MHIGIDASRLLEGRATGVERYSTELIPPLTRELTTRGHRVTVYTQSTLPKSGIVGALHQLPQRRAWTHTVLGPATLRDRVDCLFVPSHVLPIVRPRRSVVVIHDACAEEVPFAYSLRDRWYLRLTIADALRSASVVTHSTASARSLEHHFGTPAHPITVVSPGALPIPPPTMSLRFPKPFLLFIGRIERRKNVAILIQAFDELLTERPHLPHHLVLCGGDGYGAADAHRAADNAKHPERILQVGYADDAVKAAALRGASGVVVPSLCEGSSFVLLEARDAHVPFAVSALDACRDIGGDAGIYVQQPAAVESWRVALTELIDRPIPPFPPPERTWDDAAHAVADVLVGKME